ncbi:hypothetical protein MPSEU_000892400 [Mayamaea pseudoterrestris]|nr:hypothetical protein MPSEU_000892400 [Mayamaea pseudoterrestris]
MVTTLFELSSSNNIDSNSAATPATSRISNTSSSSCKVKVKAKAKAKQTMSVQIKNEDHQQLLDQMLQEAEVLATQMRSTSSKTSSSIAGSDPVEDSSTALMSRHSTNVENDTIPVSPQPSRSSFMLPDDVCSTPSRSHQDEVDAAIHSSKLMKNALLALNHSQQDLIDGEDVASFLTSNDAGFIKSSAASLPLPPSSPYSNHDSVIWDKAEFAQEGDDDYVPLVDYSGGAHAATNGANGQANDSRALGSSNHNKSITATVIKQQAAPKGVTSPSALPPQPITTSYMEPSSGITWHKIDSPTRDDEDFVPLADYSSHKPPALSHTSSLDDSDAHFSPLTRQEMYRRKTALARKKRNKWLIRILFVLLGFVTICFILGVLAGEHASMSGETITATEAKQNQKLPEQQQASSQKEHEKPGRNVQRNEGKESCSTKTLQVQNAAKEPRDKLVVATPGLDQASADADPNGTRATGSELYEAVPVDEGFRSDESEKASKEKHKSSHSELTLASKVLTSESKPDAQKNAPQALCEFPVTEMDEPAIDMASNNAMGRPCNTHSTPSKVVTKEQFDDVKDITAGHARGACQMAYAHWLLPACWQSNHMDDVHITKEDMVFALVQSMMQ